MSTEKTSPNRSLIYDFCSMRLSARREIAQRLDVWRDDETTLPEQDRMKRWIGRIADAGKVDEFRLLVMEMAE